MKRKLFGISSILLTLLGWIMMFFPQIALTLTCYGKQVSGQCNWAGTLFNGGEITLNEYRIGVFKGSVLGSLGYIFIGVAFLFLLVALLAGDTNAGIGFKLLALLFALIGTFFVWFVCVHFTYVNNLSVGMIKSGYTYESIGLGYGAIIGGIASSLACLTIIGSMIPNNK